MKRPPDFIFIPVVVAGLILTSILMRFEFWPRKK